MKALKKVGYTDSQIIEYAIAENLSVNMAVIRLFDHEQKMLNSQVPLFEEMNDALPAEAPTKKHGGLF